MKFALSIDEAAEMVGISRRHFYVEYIDKGRVKPVKCGSRSLVIAEELRGAFLQFVAERRAAPEAPTSPFSFASDDREP